VNNIFTYSIYYRHGPPPRKTKRTKRKKISSNENSESSENDNNINSINKSNNENSNNDDSHDMSETVQKMQTLTITDGQTMEPPKTSSPLHNHSNRSTEHANNFTLSGYHTHLKHW